MDKLNGDITSIFFELLPKIAVNKTLEECEQLSKKSIDFLESY